MTIETRLELNDYADLNFADNDPAEEISEADLRVFAKNISDSALVRSEVGDVSASFEWVDDVLSIADDGISFAMVDGLQAGLDAKLPSASYTAEDVLAKLLTVDGPDSGLNADLLDGFSSAAFAAASHGHTIENVTGLQGALDAKANLSGAVFSGVVTNNAQPAFSASLASTIANVTGDGTLYTLILDNEIFDQASNFNLATGVFTAPVTGKYLFSSAVILSGVLDAHSLFQIRISTSNRLYFQNFGDMVPDSNGNLSMSISIIADMDINDTASAMIFVSGSTKVVDLIHSANYSTGFQGHLAF